MSSSVDSLLREVERCADLPLARAGTLPSEAYTSEEFLDWEKQNVLANDWLCVAHTSQLLAIGDHLSLDLLGEPLVVVRDKSDQVRVLSRVCPHRAMDILGYSKPGRGHARVLLCPYHSWTFDLDGRLKACPEMHLAEGFCRDETGLREFASTVWMGFIFVNLDGGAEPLAPRLEEMGADLDAWEPENMRVVVELSWECAFNWKVLVENFMESYHHLGAHAKTLQPILPARDTWTEAERPYHVRAHLPLRESAVDEMRAAEASGTTRDFPVIATLDQRKSTEWALFLAYPNTLIFGGPDRLIWYRLDPVSAGRSRLLTTTLVPQSCCELPDFSERRDHAEEMLKTFHLEDMEMCEAVQRGLSSRGFQRGRLSHLEMPVWLFQRFHAARARGTWPTFDREAAPAQDHGALA